MFWMMLDIFSSFDPYVFNSLMPSTNMFILLNIIIISSLNSLFWLSPTREMVSMYSMTSMIMSQLTRTFMVSLKGMSSMVSTLFTLIITINLLGLIPYMFSTSSHLIFTLSLGLPLWLSLILSSFTKAPKASIAHFLPDGAPDWLNPFLVLIETTSIVVRPATLSFRLAANMSAGHIVLSLVSVYSAASMFNLGIATISLLMVTIGYILFEVAICMIQAYIFCLLLSLYADDHAHV